MQASIFIARLLGAMFVVVGVALLVKPRMFRTILSEFIRGATWLYLAGFIGLLAGMALVLTHNVWAPDWRLIITLIGWVTIVRALISIFQPQWIVAAGTAILEHRGAFVGAAVFNLIIGLVLRGPRIIAVAGNRGHLWGEQHRIETRTKPNHSRVNSGRLTIGGNYSRSLELFRLRGVNAASAKWASMLGTSERTKELGSEAEWCCRSGLN
jgi:uncharacterized membrane protein